MRKMLTPVVLFVGVAALLAQTDKTDYRQFEKKLSKDEQTLHALDRLTFGPRPGDLQAIQKIGIKKWIDLQLHPERIEENKELDARLAPLESLRLSQTEAFAQYPPRQAIRAIAQGRQKLPDDPIARAAVERLAMRLNAKKGQEDEAPQAQTPLRDLLSPAQIRTLRTGSVEEKKSVLDSIEEGDKQDGIVIAMPQPLRNQLLQVADTGMRRKMILANSPQQVVVYDLSEAKFYRALYSNRQLQEELVDFWYNHFNVFLDKGADRYLVPSYERDAIRPHVLGKFRDLLEATANSSAMMFYLDNWQSVAPDRVRRPNGKKPTRGLNENYARELMELHTLGVDGGYTQKDIIEVARCFTGWTMRPAQGGTFEYNDRVHDKGQKIVLGVTIPSGGGKEDGEKVLDILATHPSTAHFISKELAQRFVADDPPPALVDQMAKTFLSTGGDIRAVMATMLSSNEFFSEGAYRAKVKTPFEMMVSALRATGAQVDFVFPLAQQIATLGEPLYRKLEPTGYSSANAEWINSSALLARMNFALSLGQNQVAGVKVDEKQFAGPAAEVARQLLFSSPTKQTLEILATALEEEKKKNPDASPNALLAGLVLGSPDFQRK
jgi:uncharacterized protein (DUF1800 family)